MARETKEEKAIREAREQAKSEAALEAYLQTVPKRIMDAQALAQSLGITTSVSLATNGPIVNFYDPNNQVDDYLTYHTDEWELEYLERKLRDIKEERDAYIRRRGIAGGGY